MVSNEDRKTCRKLFDYLEDRRVLYERFDLEIPEECIKSVMEIRAHLTKLLTEDDDIGPAFRDQVSAIRAACRDFLGRTRQFEMLHRADRYVEFELATNLGRFRALVGVQISELSLMLDLPVPGDLRKLIPLPEAYE